MDAWVISALLMRSLTACGPLDNIVVDTVDTAQNLHCVPEKRQPGWNFFYRTGENGWY
jgi:hypothetical protein